MPNKTKELNDRDLFRQACQDTKRIEQNKIRLPAKIKKPVKQGFTDVEIAETNILNEKIQDEVGYEDFIAYKHVSISNKIFKKLKKGLYRVDAILDLHGKNVPEAHYSVNAFLNECRERQVQVALIIHGKGMRSGKPVLKNKINHWLRELNVVLAFCSATASHGSRGAIYILLKRKTEEDST